MSLSGDNTTMLVQPAGYGGNGGGWGFGGDGAWWIILFLIFGWGRGGWGGNDGGMSGGVGSEVQRGFDHSATITKLDGITTGLADLGYAINSSICNLGNVVQQGNNATQMAIMQGNNALQSQLASCCCETREAIQGVRYDLATQACDTRNTIQTTTRNIIDNANANSRAILDALNNNYIRTLESENQGLKLAASQANQNAALMAAMDAGNAELIRRLGRDCPVPAYVVPNPNCYYPNGYGYGYGGNPCGSCGG